METLEQIEVRTKIKNPLLVNAMRQSIAQACYAVFLKKGFNNTSVDEIASFMNVDKRNLYNYIGRKEDLLYLTFCHYLPLFAERIRTSMKNLNHPVEKLRAALLQNLDLTDEFPGFYTLVGRELRYLNRSYISHVLGLIRTLYEIYQKILEEGIALSLFRKCDPKIVSFAMMSMIYTKATNRWELDSYSNEAFADETFSLMVNGILARQDGSIA